MVSIDPGGIEIDCEDMPILSFFPSVSGPLYVGSQCNPQDYPEPTTERRCFCCDEEIIFRHHVYEWSKLHRDIEEEVMYSMWYNDNVELLCCKCMAEVKRHGIDYILAKKEIRENLIRVLMEMGRMKPPYEVMEIVKEELRRMGYHV